MGGKDEWRKGVDNGVRRQGGGRVNEGNWPCIKKIRLLYSSAHIKGQLPSLNQTFKTSK